MSGEPELESGISSEWVTYLQQLMSQGGYWQGAEDGEFTDELAKSLLIKDDGLRANRA
jgi:hypothetical protein